VRRFETLRSRAVPLDRSDVDTDQIIPAQHLKRIERSGFGRFAFEQWRKDPDFPLNRPEYEGAQILLAGPNFGCGSSREHAPWALEDAGFRVLAAPSFADIFRNNCANIGVLTVVLPAETIDALMRRAEREPTAELVVDLERQTLQDADGRAHPFEVDPAVKQNLLQGLDRIELTLQHEAAIAEYEGRRSELLPRLEGAGA
jgi:3-isopropylmalate/(R)-2-methylmalate dehydratase small subunit